MNILKKAMSVILVVTILLVSLSVPSFAANPTIDICAVSDKTQVSVGDTFTITVYVGACTNGIGATQVQLKYDSTKIEFQNAQNGTLGDQFTSQKSVTNEVAGALTYVDGSYAVNDAAISNPAESVLYTATFKAIASVSGNIAPELYVDIIIDGDYNEYTVNLTQPQSIEITPNLVSITAPTAITGVSNGTAKTAEALGLPTTVSIVTDLGTKTAGVTWDVASSSYNVTTKTSQTFTVNGTVTLPTGVTNTNSIPLTVMIRVTVESAPIIHTISFDSDGGGSFNDITVIEDGTYGTLPTPSKAGYKFDGWYTEVTGGDKIESTTTVNLGDTSVNKTLYAHWTEKATIEIDTDPQSYTYDGTVKTFTVNVTSNDIPAPTQASFTVSYSTANPTNAGSYKVTVSYPEDENYKAFSISIENGLVIDPVVITSITDLPTASSIKIGQALSSSTLTGGDSRFTYAWTDSTVTPSLGTTSHNVTVTLKDIQNYSYTGGNISVNVTVSEYAAATITTAILPNGTVNNPYSQTITATGESGYPITFTLESGNLPAGLTLNPNGTISGTPTVVDTYTFTVKATNIGGSDTKTYTVEIKEIPKLATPTDVTFVNGVASWTAVPNATSYKVVLYKDGQEIKNTNTTIAVYNFISAISEEGDYTVTVQAIGNGITYVDSDISGESAAYHYVPSAPDTNDNNIAYFLWLLQQQEKTATKEPIEETEWENPFKDISKTDSYYEAVRYAYENGLFKGTSEDTFDPDVAMNRAMFVTVLGRYFKVDVSKYTKADTMFDDVEADQWYTPYVQWAYESGLIYGYGDGNFGTFDIIIHEHMYLIMDRFLKMIEIEYTFEHDEAIGKEEVKRYEVAELLYEFYLNIIK